MSESLIDRRVRQTRWEQARNNRNRHHNLLNANKRRHAIVETEIEVLKNRVISEEDILQRIVARIEKIAISAASCAISLSRGGPRDCAALLVDLKNEEADHKAKLERLSESLRLKKFELIGIESEITYNEQIIDQSSDYLSSNSCSEFNIL